MKKFFIFLVLLFLVLILQLTLAGWTRRVSIDFFLVFVIYWSYSTKKLNEAVLSGFFSGLLKDIFFFPLLGINAFSFVLVSFLVNEIEGRIYHQNIILYPFYPGGCSCIFNPQSCNLYLATGIFLSSLLLHI
ncbi:rod shape-determining protein MreD [Candidatus Aerophobetes bacterium]|nr:rod shape-determining protein MreD [Candidatus Aerophobetes bacterium]